MSVYQSSVYKKNEVWEWCNPDSKELFEKNCKKYPNNESLKYYKENPIEYSFNNYGFRTPDDFNDKDDGNVFLGCSDTMGVGNHLENTWPYKVNEEIGGKFWNLSQGGSGIQTAFRLLYGFKNSLRVKNIFHLALFHPRFEFIQDDTVIKLAPWMIDDKVHFDNEPTVLEYWDRGEETRTEINSFKEFYVNILSKNSYKNFLFESYIYAFKGLARELGCNYYYLTGDDVDDTEGKSLQSRDLDMHFTVGQLNSIHEKFLFNYIGGY
jgi:hypothetical protein